MTPKIDKRSFSDHLRILEQAWIRMGGIDARGLRAHFLPRWTAQPDDPRGLDVGLVLNRLFARLMTEVGDHVNRIPEKHFAAFLDMIGVERLPGSPARVPVTFTPAPGTPPGRQVPAGTQVATTQSETNPAVAFETEDSFELTPVALVRAVTLDAGADTWRDIGGSLLDDDAAAEPILRTTPRDAPVEHSLYLVHDGFFALTDPQDLTIQFTLAVPGSATGMPVVWERRTKDGSWETLSRAANPSAWLGGGVTSVEIPGFTGSAPGAIGGEVRERPWIRARLGAPLTAVAAPFPRITNIHVLSRPPASGPVPGTFPVRAFSDTQPIDLNRDFFPFGERPQQNDAFYFASPAFQNPDPAKPRTITLTLALRPVPGVTPVTFTDAVPLANRATVAWEYWSGPNARWQSLGATAVLGGSALDVNLIRSDATIFRLTFALPGDLAERDVNGERGYWVRARIQSGGYSLPVTQSVHVGPASPGGYDVTFSREESRPPLLSVTDFAIAYAVNPAVDIPLHECASVNHFSFVDHTAVLGTGTTFTPYRSLADVAAADQDRYGGLASPALYLGYGSAFGNVRVSQLFVVEVPDAAAFREEQAVETPIVVWEYRDGRRWLRLDARDDTRALSASGTVAFTAPVDIRPSVEFAFSGAGLYWIRGRVVAGSLRAERRLDEVALNSVWARSLRSRVGEVLSNGDGKRGQVLETAQSPVLRGEVVRVREPVSPDAHVLEALELEEQTLAAELEVPLQPVLVDAPPDGASGARQYWVRWYPRPNGDASGASDRHYVIDRVTGAITFPGMALPIARANVRIDYRVNHGERARQAAQRDTVKQLTSSLPYVAKVTNKIAAQGGAGPERELAAVLKRGPLLLRHRNRAVTREDLEALAREAEPGLALVRVLPITNPAGARELGAATVIVVPFGTEPRPQPSPDLLEQIRRYLSKRGSETAEHRLYVIGPTYVEISVAVRAIPTDPAEAQALASRVGQALERFFHPLLGGRAGNGWPFAANIHVSEVYAHLERVPGLDALASLAFLGVPDPTRVIVPSNQLVSNGTHRVEVG